MDEPQSVPIGGQWYVTYIPLTPGFHNRSSQNRCKQFVVVQFFLSAKLGIKAFEISQRQFEA